MSSLDHADLNQKIIRVLKKGASVAFVCDGCDKEVKLPRGSKIAFDHRPSFNTGRGWNTGRLKKAVFHSTQPDPDASVSWLQFPDGKQVLLQDFQPGQTAKVLSVPNPHAQAEMEKMLFGH